MVVYNLYLVLNNEPVEIYDKELHKNVFIGLSNDIPKTLMDRLVHYLKVVNDRDGKYIYTLIVLD